MAGDIYDQTRLIVARLESERFPTVVGAIAETTYEIVSPEEWDKIKRDAAEQWLGPDWTEYDYAEVIVTIPSSTLNDLFDARAIEPEKVERG